MSVGACQSVLGQKNQTSHHKRYVSGDEGVVTTSLLSGGVPVSQTRCRMLTRWQRQISIARVKSVAARVIGGGLDVVCGEKVSRADEVVGIDDMEVQTSEDEGDVYDDAVSA